jgi:hypothetical protein
MASQELSKLSVLLLFDTSRFEKGLDDAQKKMMRVGRALTDVGKKMSVGLSLPLAIIGKRVTDTATEFEYQMARVQAISGATASAFNQLQKNAEALGASTIFTAREVGQLQEEFAKLGFTADQIVQVTESTLSLAQVTGASLPRAAEIAGATLRTFGMEAEEVGQVNDVVAVAISKSALDFESFAETMKYAGSQAAVSGVSMEELSAAMGVLANRGVKGSIAGTRLRMIFAKLAQEGGNVHDNFIELIRGSMTMTEAIDRFGVRAATAIPVLQENADEFFALEKAMVQSAGALEIMQERMDDTSFAAQKKLKSALEDVSIQLGKALLPMVNFVAEAFTRMANGFAMMPTFVQTLVVSFAALVAAIGPVLYLIGNLATSFPALTMLMPKLAGAVSFLLGPWGLLIAAVAALGFAIAGSYRNTSDFLDLQERIGRATKSASDNAVQATAKIRELVTAYGNENRTLEERQGILDDLESLNPEYFKGLDAETTKIDDLKASYDKLFESMMKQERAKAFMAEINRLEQERVDALLRQDEIAQQLPAARAARDREQAASTSYASTPQGLKNDFMFIGDGMTAAAGAATSLVDDLEAETADLDKTIADIEGQAERIRAMMEEGGLFKFLGTGGKKAGAGEDPVLDESDQTKAMQKLATGLKILAAEQEHLGLTAEEVAKDKLALFTTAMGDLIKAGAEGEEVGGNLDYVKDRANELADVVKRFETDANMAKVFNKMSAAVASSSLALSEGAITPLKDMENRMKATKTALDKMNDGFADQTFLISLLQKEYDKLVEKVKQLKDEQESANVTARITERVNMAIVQSSVQIGQALGAIGDKSKDAGEAMLQAATSTLSALVTQIYLLYAQKVMQDPMTPSALAKLALLGVGAGVIAGFIGSIPKLAQGGIAVGPQLAVVGDNRSGREAIIPLEKLPGLMSKMGAGSSTRVYGRLHGTDILLSSERSGRVQQRISL